MDWCLPDGNECGILPANGDPLFSPQIVAVGGVIVPIAQHGALLAEVFSLLVEYAHLRAGAFSPGGTHVGTVLPPLAMVPLGQPSLHCIRTQSHRTHRFGR